MAPTTPTTTPMMTFFVSWVISLLLLGGCSLATSVATELVVPVVTDPLSRVDTNVEMWVVVISLDELVVAVLEMPVGATVLVPSVVASVAVGVVPPVVSVVDVGIDVVISTELGEASVVVIVVSCVVLVGLVVVPVVGVAVVGSSAVVVESSSVVVGVEVSLVVVVVVPPVGRSREILRSCRFAKASSTFAMAA